MFYGTARGVTISSKNFECKLGGKNEKKNLKNVFFLKMFESLFFFSITSDVKLQKSLGETYLEGRLKFTDNLTSNIYV